MRQSFLILAITIVLAAAVILCIINHNKKQLCSDEENIKSESKSCSEEDEKNLRRDDDDDGGCGEDDHHHHHHHHHQEKEDDCKSLEKKETPVTSDSIASQRLGCKNLKDFKSLDIAVGDATSSFLVNKEHQHNICISTNEQERNLVYADLCMYMSLMTGKTWKKRLVLLGRKSTIAVGCCTKDGDILHYRSKSNMVSTLRKQSSINQQLNTTARKLAKYCSKRGSMYAELTYELPIMENLLVSRTNWLFHKEPVLKEALGEKVRHYSRRLPFVLREKGKTAIFKSRGEKACLLAMQIIYGKTHRVKSNQRPKWLNNEMTGRSLELDVYCETAKVAVEYNGNKYHYCFQDSKTCSYTMYKDSLKRKRCSEMGILLVQVPFFVPLCSIIEYILMRIYSSHYSVIPET